MCVMEAPAELEAPKAPRLADRAVLAASFAYLACLVVLYAGEQYMGERWWLTTLAAYAPQLVFAAPLPLVLGWAAVRRHRRAVLVNVAAGGFLVFPVLGFRVPFGASPPSEAPRMRVMIYNVHQAASGVKVIADAIARQNADVVCLQEVNAWGRWGDPVASIHRLLPNGWKVVRDGELVTLSRYPIVESQVHYLPSSTGRAILSATLDVRGDRITVLNTHFNVSSGESLTRGRIGVRTYLRDAAKIRLAQKTRLLEVAGRVREPVVIVGDFNTPPRGLTYCRIAKRYRDAFDAAGWSLGYTFRSDLPMLRIDHIFVDRRLKVLRCFVPQTRASDHRPVVADISL